MSKLVLHPDGWRKIVCEVYDDNGVEKNLTGTSITANFREVCGDIPVVFQISETASDIVNGKIIFSLTDIDIASTYSGNSPKAYYDVGEYTGVYSIVVEYVSGSKDVIASGKYLVTCSV